MILAIPQMLHEIFKFKFGEKNRMNLSDKTKKELIDEIERKSVSVFINGASLFNAHSNTFP